MKVQVHIKQTVEYVGHVEMTDAEFATWDKKLIKARFHTNDLAEEMIESFGPENGMRLGEPNDWGDLSVETFDPL